MGQDGYGKLVGSSGAAGLALLIVWAWNSFMPTHQMPAEMASALTLVLASAGAYLVPHAAVGGTP